MPHAISCESFPRVAVPMSRKKLKTELSILEKTFPRDSDGCFQIVIASPEELVCRFVDQKTKRKFSLQCNISVSGKLSTYCLQE